MAEAVSGSAVDGDAVHGQGLGPIDREGLNRRVLDGESGNGYTSGRGA